MGKRTTSAGWIKGIAEVLEAEGLPVHELFNAAGLDLAGLNDPGVQYPTENISLLWELATTLSNNPAIGLMKPHVARPMNFEVVSYVMMSCPNLLVALQRLNTYLRIVSSAALMELRETTEGIWVVVDIFGGNRPVPRQRVEFVLVTSLNFFRWITGRGDLCPLATNLTHPPVVDLEPYQAAFQCPVHFDAAFNGILVAHADLQLPILTFNPVLAELHEHYANEYLARMGDKSISRLVRDLIIRHLPNGEPRRDQIARALHMGERTLQRRLKDEENSFGKLLDNTRRELAQLHLQRKYPPIAQVAYLLGFSDQRAFYRACKRWFGLPPSEFRAELHR